MAFSRDPNPSIPQRSDTRRPDRRARRAQRRASPPDRRVERSRLDRENKRQRLAIIFGVAIILAVGGIIGYGYYDNYIAPSQTLAARVRDTEYTRGDLVKRLRLVQATTGSIDLRIAPLEELFNMVYGELIRQGADVEGVVVTDGEIEDILRTTFSPTPPEGQETDPGQLEREYKETYRQFLASAQTSDKEYRGLVADTLYRSALRERLGERILEELEHVEVNWIRLPRSAPTDPDDPLPTPSEVVERLQTEDFSVVAQSVSLDSDFDPDGDGYVGWVAKGVFPQLDETLFGRGGKEPIPHNEISDPISTSDANYIVKVVAGPEVREIDDRMRSILKDKELQQWVTQQQGIGIAQGWLEINFTGDLYTWVVDQLSVGVTPIPAVPG